MDAVLPNEIFTSTTVIANSLRMFVDTWSAGYLMGYNKNKFIQEIAKQFDTYIAQEQEEEPSLDESDEEDESEEADDEAEKDLKEKKKDKFQGAYVMNPLHMLSTGYKMLGALSKFIHMYVIDMDIGSK